MIIDISMSLDSRTVPYPGDCPFSRRVHRYGQIETSDAEFCVHLGTHADAPRHFGFGSSSIGEAPLDAFVGPCTVVHPHTNNQLVEKGDFRFPKHPERVLFRFQGNQTLSPACLQSLIDAGCRLVGSNRNSLDLDESDDFPIHHLGLSKGLYFLENLVLDSVTEGDYFLSAAPLKLTEAEASPVRALLLPLAESGGL